MNRRNKGRQFDGDYYDSPKIKRVCQISPFTKVVLSTLVALIWILVTEGTPRLNALSGVAYVDRSV